MLSLSQSHSPFNDAAFPKSFGKCHDQSPMSAPTHDRVQRSTSPWFVPEELLQRYITGKRIWIPQIKKEICAGCKGVKPREEALNLQDRMQVNSSLRKNYRLESVDLQRKPRFCTGLNCGKGDTVSKDVPKETRRVLSMTTPYRDDTKGVWFRKSGQEGDNGHRQCCSQHWVSVLNTNEKICHVNGRAADSRKSGGNFLARAKSSPTTNSKFVAMAAQKLRVQDKRFLPLVVRNLDLSYSSLPNLEAIVHDMSRLPRTKLFKPSDAGFNVNHVPSSASAFMSCQKSSIDIDRVKLQSPRLNSTAWLVARMEALKKETFTVSKALQIAKEHGIALDKKDVATLKKFFQSDQRPSIQCDAPDPSQLQISKSSEK